MRAARPPLRRRGKRCGECGGVEVVRLLSQLVERNRELLVVSIDSDHGVGKVVDILPGVIVDAVTEPAHKELVTAELGGRASGKDTAVDNTVDGILASGNLVAIGDQWEWHQPRDVEGVVEASGRQTGELVVVVLEDLFDTVRPMSWLVPLGSGATAERAALLFDDQDALLREEGEGGVVLGVTSALGRESASEEAMPDEAPAGVEAIDESSNVGMDVGRGRVEAVVGDVQG